MATTLKQNSACALEQAKSVMADKLKKLLARYAVSAHASGKSTILRVRVRIEPLSPLKWLAAQRMFPIIYWSDRQNRFEMAGIGAADMVASKRGINYAFVCDRLSTFLNTSCENLRYYGGFRFAESNKDCHDGLWESFGSYRFILPRLELYRQSDQTFLACHVVLGDSTSDATEIFSALEGVAFSTEVIETEPLHVIARYDNPDKKDWEKIVHAVLESIRSSELQKLVLARRTTFEFPEPLHALHLIEKLKAVTPNCYHFLFRFEDNQDNAIAFIGASPERLYYRSGAKIRSEAVAGTRARGHSEGMDQVLEQELIASDKEQREHQYVVQGIQEAFEQIGCRVRNNGVSVMKLANLQHLVTRFEGVLADGAFDADLLQRLHPTPAVGGYPVDRALTRIRGMKSLEPFDRGWYAGPVGWIGRNEAEFAVGIRSGLVEHNRLHLYAGAGIVRGSTPESEWREIEDKVNNFIKALTE
jgi:menaquinone-specific isochorismate synthase